MTTTTTRGNAVNSTRARSGNEMPRPRGAARALAFAVACFLTGEVCANPTGAEVVAGHVDIVASPNQLLITNSPGAITPGCSDISPPSSAHRAWRHPSATPETISSISSGTNAPTEM